MIILRLKLLRIISDKYKLSVLFQNHISSKFETLPFSIPFFYKFNIWDLLLNGQRTHVQYTKQKGK